MNFFKYLIDHTRCPISSRFSKNRFLIFLVILSIKNIYSFPIDYISINQNIRSITSHNEISPEFPTNNEALDGLLVARTNPQIKESYMVAHGFHRAVGEGKSFRLTREGLIPSQETTYLLGDFAVKEGLPQQHLCIKGQWNFEDRRFDFNNNILGENGSLKVEEITVPKQITLDLSHSPIEIPVIALNLQNRDLLKYYGAEAILMGETVTFPQTFPYPLWTMSIGSGYVSGFLHNPNLGGEYIEWHRDKPHFHMPLSSDAGGYYILGKEVNNHYCLSGFRIPFGLAVYTKPGVIHADGHLVGSAWVVGYDSSEDYETVILKTQNGSELLFFD